MDVDESSGNDTEEDEPCLRDPREIAEDSEADADAETQRDDMDEDDENDDDGDSNDGSEESAAGSSDLEGPLVTPAIQDRHIKDIMGFQHDWNKELIAQFYATVYFGHDAQNDNERTIY
ncbi:phosphopantothenoylcysteine decarboxylase subunit SIS2-like [Panicum virgatum]|uniref:phosphopantothenoylcysteine decarboxylase subunit SIS2-like n=1 Tax=Panicum virgatum TaxID=38727 RepID=UPI0019D5E099|nr:phosphopantothenoylcysteine decarboxylase subunit SIS2-like [Panicum virgatum]